MKLRSHLVALVLATAIPLLVFALTVVLLYAAGQRETLKRGAMARTSTLAIALDRELSGTIDALRVLATSPHLDAGDLRNFYDHARRVLEGHRDRWVSIVLADPSGQQRLTLLKPFGTPLPQAAATPWIKEAVVTGSPVISDRFVGSVAQRPLVSVLVPVVRDGSVKYVLLADFEAQTLWQRLRYESLPRGWIGGIVDRNKTLIARTHESERLVGQPATPVTAQEISRTPEGWFRGPMLDGHTRYGAFSRSAVSGWTVLLRVPISEVDGPVWRSMGIVLGVGGALALLAVALAMFFARRIVAPIASMLGIAKELGRGELVPVPVSSAVQEVRELGEALQDTSRLLAERDAALRQEAEHRRVTLASIGDAVIATDAEGHVTLMNAVAQALTGWSDADAIGRPLAKVFTIVNEQSRRPVENPIALVLREGKITGLANHTVLISKDGREIPIDDSAAPIRGADGTVLGAVLIFRDVSERRQVERERAASLDRERAARAGAEQLAARLRHLQSITDTTLTARALDDLLRDLLARVRAAMASDTATVWLLAEDGVHLTPVSSDGLQADVPESIRIPLGRGAAGRIALSDQGMIIDDLSTVEVLSPFLRDRVKSLIGAPLKVRDRLLGVVHVGASQPRRFTEEDLGLLRLVADRAALAIERARLDEAERDARVRAEAAEQRLRLALQAGRMGTWEWVIATGELRWSSTLEAIHGFAPGTFPGTFEAFRTQIHPDDRDHILRAVAEAVEERRELRIEYRNIGQDGAVRWVEGHGQLVDGPSGRPERMVGVCGDVTERKQAEETFRLAVEAAPTAMIMVDQHGTIRLVNALVEPLFGYTRHELVGQSIERLVPPQFRGRHGEYRAGFTADPRRRAMGQGRDLYALRKDGTEVPVEIGLSPLETAHGVFVLAAITDITERKRAEQRQAAQYGVTRVLSEATSLEGAAPQILEAVCKSLGWDVGALWTVDRLAAVLRCVDVWHPPSVKVTEFEAVTRTWTFAPGVGLVGRVWARAEPIWLPNVLEDDNFPRAPFAAQGGLHAGLAFPIRLAGKVLGVIEFLSREVRQPDGELLSAMASIGSQIGQFIERRRAEDERAQLLVSEQAAREEAETANRAKDEFLAMLSHELRTPLNTVLGWTRMLRSKTLDEAAVARALEVIERNAKAQTQLIEDLLDVSRIVSGKLHLDLRSVDPAAVARAAIEAVQSSAVAEGIHLEAALDPSGGPIAADPGRLRQVVSNLLSNAIKFTPTGGRVEIRLERPGSRVLITVTDTGRGISADFLPYVFDRFRQAPSPDPQGGLGLGLAIVRHIVELHGGSVHAASAGEGHGATFTVDLPIVSPASIGPRIVKT